jgi:hypothetical protein
VDSGTLRSSGIGSTKINPFEVGKWYIVKGYEERGPGKCIGFSESSNSLCLEHLNWDEGHDGSGEGLSGKPDHCWVYHDVEASEIQAPRSSNISDCSCYPMGAVLGKVTIETLVPDSVSIKSRSQRRAAILRGLTID